MAKVDQLIGYASAEIGEPYVFGAEGPGSFDCSGLMQWVFAKVGIKLPRTAAQQQAFTKPVTGKPQPGDLVFWGRPASHVGLYIGGGKMIDAPHPGARVGIHTVYGTPSGYHRVAGLGAALAPVLAPVAGVGATAAATVQSWLDGVRYSVLEVVVAGAGLGLVGYGLWRAVGPRWKEWTRWAS
jgi:NlpC/P60 family